MTPEFYSQYLATPTRKRKVISKFCLVLRIQGACGNYFYYMLYYAAVVCDEPNQVQGLSGKHGLKTQITITSFTLFFI